MREQAGRVDTTPPHRHRRAPLAGSPGLTVAAGAVIAVAILVWPALVAFVERADRLGREYGFQALPAITLASLVYGVHQHQRRRHAVSSALAAAAVDAANRRVAELERFVAFSGALLRARDGESIRAAAHVYMPGLCEIEDRDVALLDDPGQLDRIQAGQRRVIEGARELIDAAEQNSESFRQAYENSRQDSLTGCFNRTHAIETLESEIRRARRSRAPLSLVLFDLDHFKAVNDRFGHLCGDGVLAAIGARIRTSTRSSDVKCRYGGEEFLVILPDTPLHGARQVAENLRRVIAKDPVPWNDGQIGVTASFGVTQVASGETDPIAVIARADVALYRAKGQGRDAVVVADPPPRPGPPEPGPVPARLTTVN